MGSQGLPRRRSSVILWQGPSSLRCCCSPRWMDFRSRLAVPWVCWFGWPGGGSPGLCTWQSRDYSHSPSPRSSGSRPWMRSRPDERLDPMGARSENRPRFATRSGDQHVQADPRLISGQRGPLGRSPEHHRRRHVDSDRRRDVTLHQHRGPLEQPRRHGTRTRRRLGHERGGAATPLGGAPNLLTVGFIEESVTGQEFFFLTWVMRLAPVTAVIVLVMFLFLRFRDAAGCRHAARLQAIAIVVPITISTFQSLDLNPIPFVYIVTVIGNCGFLLPSSAGGPAVAAAFRPPTELRIRCPVPATTGARLSPVLYDPRTLRTRSSCCWARTF